MGTAEEYRSLASQNGIDAWIPVPAEADEVGSTLEAIAGPVPIEASTKQIEHGDLKIDVARKSVYIAGKQIELPPREFALLTELASRIGEPIPAKELVRKFWPSGAWTSPDDARRAIYRLRSLIGDHDRAKPLIRTRRGHGYMLDKR